MQPEPKIIGLSFHKTMLSCSWLEQQKSNQVFLCKAYEVMVFNHLEYFDGIIFNTTAIVRTIQSFIQKYKAHNAYAMISLGHQAVTEKIITLHRQLPQSHHISDSGQAIVWDYQRLNADSHTGKQSYYLCSIPKEMQFQTQLITLLSDINCIGIIPARAALLEGCYHIQSASDTAPLYNHGSLQAMMTYAVNECVIADYVYPIPPHLSKEHIVEGIGLLLLGKRIYEKN
jgi:hypothetical protein